MLRNRIQLFFIWICVVLSASWRVLLIDFGIGVFMTSSYTLVIRTWLSAWRNNNGPKLSFWRRLEQNCCLDSHFLDGMFIPLRKTEMAFFPFLGYHIAYTSTFKQAKIWKQEFEILWRPYTDQTTGDFTILKVVLDGERVRFVELVSIKSASSIFSICQPERVYRIRTTSKEN